MKRGLKITLWVLLVVVAAVVVLLVVKKRKSNAENENAEDANSNSSNASSNKAVAKSSDFPLKKNASVKSETVKQLQELLNEKIGGLVAPVVPYDADGNPITQLKVDGYYGDKTAAVVKYIFNNDGNEVTEEQFNELKK